MISFFKRCSLASEVTVGLEADVPEALSTAEETHAAGPSSGLSRPLLCIMAHTRRLWACSVEERARRK